VLPAQIARRKPGGVLLQNLDDLLFREPACIIKSHDAAKDWWSMAVLVTTAGNKLNKAHVAEAS